MAVFALVLNALARSGALAPNWPTKVAGFTLGMFAWGFAGTMAYHVLSESIGGASLGKWICGLRVHSAYLRRT